MTLHHVFSACSMSLVTSQLPMLLAVAMPQCCSGCQVPESVAMTVLASPGLRTAAYLPTAEWRPRRLRLRHSAVPSVPADQGGIFWRILHSSKKYFHMETRIIRITVHKNQNISGHTYWSICCVFWYLPPWWWWPLLPLLKCISNWLPPTARHCLSTEALHWTALATPARSWEGDWFSTS